MTPQKILQTVCSRYGLSIQDVKSKSRASEIVFARQIYMYLCNELTTLSLFDIGAPVGQNVETVMSGIEIIKKLVINDESFSNEISSMEHELSNERM